MKYNAFEDLDSVLPPPEYLNLTSGYYTKSIQEFLSVVALEAHDKASFGAAMRLLDLPSYELHTHVKKWLELEGVRYDG